MVNETAKREGGIDMEVIVHPEHLFILPMAGGSNGENIIRDWGWVIIVSARCQIVS